jgi:hypothetical protein
MAAVYGSIIMHQVALADDTAEAVALPTARTADTRVTVSGIYKTGHAARTAPIHFIFGGASDEPTTVAAGDTGAGSPCLPPGVAAVEVASIPSAATHLILKSLEGGDIWVQIHQEAR